MDPGPPGATYQQVNLACERNTDAHHFRTLASGMDIIKQVFLLEINLEAKQLLPNVVAQIHALLDLAQLRGLRIYFLEFEPTRLLNGVWEPLV